MREIVAELDVPDGEHPDTWLSHDSGWTVSAHVCGRVVLENVEEPGQAPCHMLGVSRERVLELWLLLAAGDIEEVKRRPWLPGDGKAPETDAEKAERIAAWLAVDRNFYDSLGAERPDQPCAEAGCTRGAVRASVFCRTHQFENAMRRPCPFAD